MAPPAGDPDAPPVDVDRATIEAILALPIDGADLAAELDAAEAPIVATAAATEPTMVGGDGAQVALPDAGGVATS